MAKKWEHVNAIYFVQVCISAYRMEQKKTLIMTLNFEMSVHKGACAVVKSTPNQDTIEGTKWKK